MEVMRVIDLDLLMALEMDLKTVVMMVLNLES